MCDCHLPRSVVDVGCGVGIYLEAFYRRGITDLRGVDIGAKKRDGSTLSDDLFVEHDLNKPYAGERTFDLAISLETAEHLSPQSANTFVQTLTGLSDVVIFSAAVPLQGGFRHINEQWQHYWAERFGDRGYVPIDCLRCKLWHAEDVPLYYRQNMLMYVRKTALDKYPLLARESERTHPEMLSIIHPEFYLAHADIRRHSLRSLLRGVGAIPSAAVRAVKRRLKR